MQEKSLFKKRILEFIEYKHITKYEFYQKSGITRGVLDQNNGLSEDNVTKFLAYFTDVNAEWFLTGKGEMLRNFDINTQKISLECEKKDKEIAELKEKIAELSDKYISLLEKISQSKTA